MKQNPPSIEWVAIFGAEMLRQDVDPATVLALSKGFKVEADFLIHSDPKQPRGKGFIIPC